MNLYSKISIWVLALVMSFLLGMFFKGEILIPREELGFEGNRLTLRLPRNEREWKKKLIGNISERVLLEEMRKMGFYPEPKK